MLIWALFLFCISGGRGGLDYWGEEEYIQGKKLQEKYKKKNIYFCNKKIIFFLNCSIWFKGGVRYNFYLSSNSQWYPLLKLFLDKDEWSIPVFSLWKSAIFLFWFPYSRDLLIFATETVGKLLELNIFLNIHIFRGFTNFYKLII